MMQRLNNWYRLSLFPVLAVGPIHAAPIEGELGSNAAVLLVLLGLGALLMGMRNLRELRHKRLVPERQPANNHHHPENPGPDGRS
jgi:hypothetical protein